MNINNFAFDMFVGDLKNVNARLQEALAALDRAEERAKFYGFETVGAYVEEIAPKLAEIKLSVSQLVKQCEE